MERRLQAVQSPGRPILLAVCLGLSLVLGGAGETRPLLAYALGLLLLVALALTPHTPARTGPDKAALAIVWGLPLLALLQTLPLPPALWQALPGRDLAMQLDGALGWQAWRPLSLTPDLSFEAAIFLLAPLATFMITRASRHSQRMTAMRAIVALALASALLGILQAATGADSPLYPWDTPHRGLGLGFFVNRNHQAAFLLVAMVFAGLRGTLPAERTFNRHAGSATFLVAGALLVLAGAVLATASRTGLVLVPLALVCAAYLRFGKYGGGRIWGLVALLVLGLVLAALGAGAASEGLQRLQLAGSDGRWFYWQNTWPLVQHYWLTGSGYGSFRALYQQVEPLDQVSPLYVAHAHSDWMEWLLEGGLPCGLLVLAALALVLRRARSLMPHGRRHQESASAMAGGAGMVLLALASLTDYPLRTTALAVLFAFCAALMLFATPADDADDRPARPVSRWMAGVAAIGVLTNLAMSLSSIAIQRGDYDRPPPSGPCCLLVHNCLLRHGWP